jgi:hypothetical protein
VLQASSLPLTEILAVAETREVKTRTTRCSCRKSNKMGEGFVEQI